MTHVISNVSYNAAHTHIEQVFVHSIVDNQVLAGAWHPRMDVIYAIERGARVWTIYRDKFGNWAWGSSVLVIVIRGIKYLKTVNNGLPCDNLENLPEMV